MPSVSSAQARLMSAIAHGWHAPMKSAPPLAVAREFHDADKRAGKYMHAEGGYINPVQTPKSGVLGALASAARWAGGPENADARAHLVAGLASQVYGLGKDGTLKLGGGSIDEAPGAVDELLAIPAEFAGHHAPQASIDANEHVARLRNKILSDMGLHDPHGWTQQLASAAGTMMGQIPVPAGALGRAVSAALEDAPKAVQGAVKVAAPAAEWLSPTIHPTAGNYIAGSLFGGLTGGGADALSDPTSNKYAMGGLAAVANSSLGGGRIRGLSIGHPSTMRQIIHPHLMLNPRTPGGGIRMPTLKFADGGKVGPLASALKALSELIQGHPMTDQNLGNLYEGIHQIRGVNPQVRENLARLRGLHDLTTETSGDPALLGHLNDQIANNMSEALMSPDVTPRFSDDYPLPEKARGGFMRNTDFGALTGLHMKYCMGGQTGYAEGGKVNFSRALQAIHDAMTHLGNNDRASAIRALSGSRDAMAHPAVPGIIANMRSPGGMRPASEGLAGMLEEDKNSNIMPTFAVGGPVMAGMAPQQSVQAPPGTASTPATNPLMPMLKQVTGGIPADLSSYYTYGAHPPQGAQAPMPQPQQPMAQSPMQQQVNSPTLQGQMQYPQGSPQAQQLGKVGLGNLPPAALNSPIIRQLLMNLSKGAPRSQIPSQVMFPGAGAR